MQIFKPITLVKNLPLTIECLSAHNDCIVIATKQGHLMKYRFSPKRTTQLSTTNELEFDVDLVESFKQFQKKPVTQVETVPELKIIITLSDGLVHINNLDDLSSFQVLQKTKGASFFATNLKTQKTLTGEVQYMLRMCVVVRRKIVLLYWKNKNFHEMSREINLNNQPKTIAWCAESLFVGYKTEYDLIKLNGDEDEVTTLSATGGRQLEPTIKLLQNDKVGISRDENTYILDAKGEPHLNYSVTWSDIPTSYAEDYPYLIALLPSSIVEVRSIEPHLFIQRLELAQLTSSYSKIKILVECAGKKGFIIAASNSDIFALIAQPISLQKTQMVAEKHFELAKKLAKMETGTSTRDIELLYAHDLFQKGNYKKALKKFFKLDISPVIVIGLFPDLADDIFTKPDSPSDSGNVSNGRSDVDSEDDRLIALMDYLIEIRYKILTFKGTPQAAGSAGTTNASSSRLSVVEGLANEDEFTLSSHMKSAGAIKRLRQEVDTTMMKCYLKTDRSSLVSSLLRLPDNHCRLQVTEKALLKYHKYNELIILYKSRSLHRRALELLKSHFQDSPVEGYEKTVQYLQHLGQEHLEIICEYALWVLKDKPDLGLKIFTADLPETEQLDRNLVLEFLRHNAPQMEIPYLEHIIFFWYDKTSFFHTTLLLRYRQKVTPLLSAYLKSIDGSIPCPAGQEPGELGELRRRLLDFLEISDHYTTQGLPALLMNEQLCEERAIVVGKLGQHEEALSIFIYVLNNPKRAEEYCECVYKKKLPNSKDIFLTLLKLYLHPPNTFSSDQIARKMSVSSASQMSASSSHVPINFSSKIIKLLKDHGDKIDPLKAILELPDEFNIDCIKEYLNTTFKRKLQESHEKEMFRQLILSKFYQVQKTWIQLQQANKIVVDETTLCQVCTRKIGRSAFVRFPNLDLVHYSCRDRYGRVL